MGPSKQGEIREVLKSLAYTHSLVVEQMESMICVLTKLLEVDELNAIARRDRPSPSSLAIKMSEQTLYRWYC